MQTVQDVFAVVLVAACAWAIVSPRVPTGILVTAGLLVILASALGALDEHSVPNKLLTTAFAGNVLVALGLLIRAYRTRKSRPPGTPLRRSTDFGAFDDAPTVKP